MHQIHSCCWTQFCYRYAHLVWSSDLSLFCDGSCFRCGDRLLRPRCRISLYFVIAIVISAMRGITFLCRSKCVQRSTTYFG